MIDESFVRVPFGFAWLDDAPPSDRMDLDDNTVGDDSYPIVLRGNPWVRLDF